MRVLVTGSGGYIAQGVIAQLVARGHEVIAIGHTPLGFKDESIVEIVGDAFDFDFGALDVLPDVLLHLAWRDGFNHRAISHLEDLPRHYEFLLRAAQAGVGQIAVMGSMHEIGYWEGEIDETTPCNPTTPYGVAKNALRQLTEGLCRQEGLRWQWLRGFYLCSADGRGDSIFAKIVKSSKAGNTSFPFTSGEAKYDFLPYDEFCFQIASAISQTEVTGIINICSGNPIALKDYVESFIEENGLSIVLEYGKYPDRPYDSPAIWGSNKKIMQVMKNEGLC